jgi:triosephosphate isomerase (TIM)
MVKVQNKKTATKKRPVSRVITKKLTFSKKMPKKRPVVTPKKLEITEGERKTYQVIANWKMNPASVSEARNLFNDIKDRTRLLKRTRLVLCPPLPYLEHLKNLYSGKKITFGAQTCFVEHTGSFTGEIGAPMIKSVGADYVILGHSERRAMGETDETIRVRIDSALSAHLTPVVCIGESVRDDEGDYLALIKQQMQSLFYGMSRDWLRRVVIAYEPIWAIGKTGKDAVTGHSLHETAIYIRKVLSEMFDKSIAIEQKILYGGSVKAENAASLIDGTQIDGFLVGSASLDSDEFVKITEAVEAYAKQ